MNRWMNSLEIKDRMIEQLVGECMMMKEKIDEMEIERRKGVIAG